MKVLLDIKDEKASFILRVLKDFKYVKAEPFTEKDIRMLAQLEEAVEQFNL